MSQWNNSYAYNNQYQGSENWNEMNGQYVNQANYRSDVNQQYVSFNEFINQMQNTNATAASNFNPVQYEGYPNNQYSYQNAPSGSQTQGNYNYGPTSATSNVPSEVETYQANQNQYKPQPNPNQYTNEMVLNSNLTATATEFVPKSSGPKPSSSAQNIPEPSSSSSNEVPTTTSNHSSSSNKNWRERTSCNTQKSDREKPQINGYENNKNFGNNRNKDSYRKENNRHYENNSRPENNGRNNDNNGRNNENRTRHENNSINNENPVGQEKNSRHNGNKGRATENNVRGNDTSGQNNEYSERNNDKGGRYNENNSRSNENSRRYNENTGRYNENNSGRHNENNSRHNENNGRYSENSRNSVASNETGNRNNEYSTRQDREYDNNRNDRRNGKGKAKGKDSDNRTFYNSSINVQDARNGRGEGSGRNRTWAGSQRIRERENMDDEQFANNYVPQKEERLEKERSYKPQSTSSPARYKNKNQGDQVSKEMTQRERLTEQLDKGTLECLVCCERVKQIDPVWACGNCYHVFHLKCIKKWAVSSSVEGKWRCPACQNCCSTVPSEYRCMCGAMRSPEYVRGAGAHTCGAACGRPRVCPHRCPLRCHPGPCPPCQATVNKQCGCGAETRSVLCSSKLPQVCGRVCGRPLACGNHKCVKDCHEGPCDECDKTITEVCYCPLAGERSAACGAAGRWSCGGACGRVAACGAHVCRAACHAPPCARCPRDPRHVSTCPCGKNKLDKDQRKLCTDPIPLCGNICAKPLPCGPDGDRHFCKIDCHEGPCPPCPEKTLVQCRCGHSSREVPCSELPETLGNVLCQKKCNKKLSCGRHRCRAVCCAGGVHRCGVVCGRSLSCGLHRCDEFCHTGHCAVCPRLSFTELRCTCGATALLPPVACGARAPACSAPCGRARACGHAALHACHAGACPPCVVLTARRCHGGHEQRRTVPCDQPAFSCGRPCDKPLPCGKHSCINTCHAGPCDTTKCTQPCREKRPSCGHECSAPCHVGGGTPCPSAAPCRRVVRATCQCGRRAADRTCSENAKDFAKMVSALAAAKIQEGESVDLSDVQRPGNMLKTLECDDSCRQEARSRALALALQLRNPDVSSKLAPRYSELLRQTAARDAPFASMVHDRLTELVQRAKKSKQKTRSHSFPSMNRQKRQFIHEMCEHFGCESVAYDAEPNRNVVATADKEKSWLPAMSVCEVVSREAGRRRVPPPVVRQQAPTSSRSSSGWATLTSTNAWAARSQAKVADEQVKETKEETKPAKIDYFDNPPEN